MVVFEYGNTKIEYSLLPQKRKTLSLTIKPDKRIILKCPDHAEASRIEDFLKRKWKWIQSQLTYFENFDAKSHVKEYISGESYLYLGKQYKLIVKNSDLDAVSVSTGNIIVQTLHHPDKAFQSVKVKNILKKWYSLQTRKIFNERFKEMMKRFELENAPVLRIKSMEKRWGSFINTGKIVLNPLLIQTSVDCIDYVIVHELCHLRYKKHSKYYWALLTAKYPGWEKQKEKLEKRVFSRG